MSELARTQAARCRKSAIAVDLQTVRCSATLALSSLALLVGLLTQPLPDDARAAPARRPSDAPAAPAQRRAEALAAPAHGPADAPAGVATPQNPAAALLRSLTPAQREARRRSDTVLAIQAVAPAVVAITSRQVEATNPYVDTPWGRYYRKPTGSESMVSFGSGVIVDPSGIVVTNEHVVSRATRIEVRTADGRTFEAKVAGASLAVDLAVLRIRSPKPMPSAPLADSSRLLHGETVLAIGNPFGLAQTVSRGVLSSTQRTFESRQGTFFHWVQTDAAINPGNSGGPLVNILGEVIAINTARHTGGPGISFAIPANVVKVAMADLLLHGHIRPPWLGLDVGPVRGLGARVSEVFAGGPAAKAGVRQGDVILGLAGMLVADQYSFWRILRSLLPGQRAMLRLARGDVAVTVEGRAAPPPTASECRFALRMGMRVGNAAELVRAYGLQIRRGAVLTAVTPGGRAARRNLRPGDVILSVNKHLIDDMEDLDRVTRGAVPGLQFIVEVQRGSKTYTFVVAY